VFDLFSLLMQAEIENLTMEERRLDEQIRFGCLASDILLYCIIAVFACCLLRVLLFFYYCREMQEKLRDLSEDENNEK
jgi:hypothetical protein